MGRKKLPNPKGHNYTHPCPNCQKPCFGKQCRDCSNAALPMAVRMGAKNRGVRRESEPAWWVTPTREAFQAKLADELPRLMAVKVSGVASLTTVWD